MKKVFQTILIAASVFFTACKNPETGTEKSKVDTITTATTENKSSMPDYDPALDPWNVEAPFGKKFGDTLGIKMFEVTLKPGDTVPLHRHPDYTLYVVQGGKIAITTEGKGRQEIDLPTGAGLVNPTTTHSGKNIGKTTIRLLVTDIHRPRLNE